jgi:D-glycero-alpha-D-manno-heptose-7-phosphate kinase
MVPTTIRGKAPLRISFAGGDTDVSPYREEHGDCVLSCTIDKYSYCTLVPRNDDKVAVMSLDYHLYTSYVLGERLCYGGKLDMVNEIFT